VVSNSTNDGSFELGKELSALAGSLLLGLEGKEEAGNHGGEGNRAAQHEGHSRAVYTEAVHIIFIKTVDAGAENRLLDSNHLGEDKSEEGRAYTTSEGLETREGRHGETNLVGHGEGSHQGGCVCVHDVGDTKKADQDVDGCLVVSENTETEAINRVRSHGTSHESRHIEDLREGGLEEHNQASFEGTNDSSHLVLRTLERKFLSEIEVVDLTDTHNGNLGEEANEAEKEVDGLFAEKLETNENTTLVMAVAVATRVTVRVSSPVGVVVSAVSVRVSVSGVLGF